MKKRTSTIIKVGIAIAVIAGVGLTIKSYVGKKVENVNQADFQLYSEATVERKDLETYTRGNGLFSSFNTASIKVDEGSKVTKQFVNDGDVVSASQNIFLINNGMESSYVKTPIPGFFFEKQGENSTATYQVYDTATTGVLIQVSEENVAKLQIGQPAKVLFTAIEKEVDGQVSYISKVAENGNFPVRISVPYTEDLRFGYNASIKIVTASKPQALCIPYNAVQHDGDKAYVIKGEHRKELNKTFKITEKMRTYITVGASDNDYVEVLEGLQEKDKVLMESMN